MQKKYVIVTVGTIVMKAGVVYIKCVLCGGLCGGVTQQDQVENLFKCLSTHIPERDLFEIYEQRDKEIVTSINREVWDKIRRRYKK